MKVVEVGDIVQEHGRTGLVIQSTSKSFTVKFLNCKMRVEYNSEKKKTISDCGLKLVRTFKEVLNDY